MNISSKHQLIGIAGSFASGKDTIAHHLEKDFGFTHVSTGDMVREVAMAEHGSIERPVLHAVGDEHRHRDGAGAFVNHALKKPRPLVITGIRALGEAKALKAAGGMLLFVDAPVEVRYGRVKLRNRDAEVELTLDQFITNEEKEWYSGEGDADFNLRGIKTMSDVVIDNILPLEEFIKFAYHEIGLTQESYNT